MRIPSSAEPIQKPLRRLEQPLPVEHRQDVLTQCEQAWSQHPEAAHALPLAQAAGWQAAQPVRFVDDGWTEPTYPEDPLAMSWDALWPSLAEGTAQVDQQDFYSDDPWPVSINSSPSHHSWMRCVRTVRIRDDFNDLDHFLFAHTSAT